MSRRSSFPTEAEVARVVRGAIKGGLAGGFVVEAGDGIVRLLPAPASAPQVSGSSASEALAKWRKSA